MIRKNNLSSLLITIILVSTSIAPAYAVSSAVPLMTREKIPVSNIASAPGIVNRSTNLKDRATKEIDRRVDSLQKLITKLSGMKKLTVDQISSLTKQIQDQITNLQTLKTKILADTDEATLKTDVQSIVATYRIYAFFVPKVHILATAERLLTVVEQMTSLETKLESRVFDAKSTGKDVTQLDAALLDMKAKIADANTQANKAIETVTALTPDTYPANKTALQNCRQLLSSALHDLNSARQDAHMVIWGLSKSAKPSGTMSTSQAPTK